jgi:hypothetical protein
MKDPQLHLSEKFEKPQTVLQARLVVMAAEGLMVAGSCYPETIRDACR